MDRRFLATLGLRLLGLYALLQALVPLGFLVTALTWTVGGNLGLRTFDWGSAISLVAWLVAGLTLLRLAPRIAARMAGEQEAQSTSSPFTPRTLEVLGYRLLGARGLANLVERLRGAGLQEAERAWKSPSG